MTKLKCNMKKVDEKNYGAYEDLKIALSECPNLTFNQYILDFVKPFIKKGRFEKNKKSNNFSFMMHDSCYKAYIWFTENKDKIEVSLSLTPISKSITLNSFYRKVIFDKDLITLVDRIKYEDEKIEDKTTFSLFQNSCPINELGDNVLVCKIVTESNVDYKEKHSKVKALRINERKEGAIEEWDSQTNESKYFKTKNVFTTFEDALIGEYLNLEKEEVSFKYIIDFINNLPNRNLNCKRKIEEEKQNAPKGTDNLVLF